MISDSLLGGGGDTPWEPVETLPLLQGALVLTFYLSRFIKVWGTPDSP